MIKKEYQRLIKSKASIVEIIILLIITVVCYVILYIDKLEFISQMDAPSDDLNLYGLQKIIDNYNGFGFLFKFWYTSDFYAIYVIVALLFIGIALSYKLQSDIENNYGNLLISRSNYKKYLDCIIMSQSLYILTIIVITNLLSLIIAMFFGGFGKSASIATVNLNIYQSVIIFCVQTILMSCIFIFTNACSLLISVFIKNKYVLQAIPLFVFFITPQLIVSTLGNVSSVVADITLPFVVQNELMAVYNILNDYVNNNYEFVISEIFYYLIPLFTYFILFLLLYIINLREHERNYL